MPKKAKALVLGLFLALVGIACVALFAGKARAEEENEWEPGDPYPPISGNGWGISEDGTLTVVTNAGWRDFLANGPGEWVWEYEDSILEERVQKLVIGKSVTALSIYDPTRENKDSEMEVDYLFIGNSGIYKPYVSVIMQDPKCMPPEIEVEEGNGVFSVENGLLINNVRKSVVLSEIDVTDVVMPEGIREIEAWAFYYRNITSVVFPVSLEIIGAAAFSNCGYLTEVGLPNTLTRIDTCAFAGCDSLKKATISSGLNTIEGFAFYGCPLENVTIPEGIQTIGFMAFSYCVDLERVSLPESLETIDNYAFADCKNLKDIKLPSKLSYIGYRAFEFCESLQVILMPNSLTTIGEQAFLGCKSTLVQLPEKLTVKAIPPVERGWSLNLEEEYPSTRLLGFEYVETLIVSGSKYSAGDYLIEKTSQVVFLQKPPADWSQITTSIDSLNVSYLDEYASDWKTMDRKVWKGLSLHELTRNKVGELILTTQRLVEEGYTAYSPHDYHEPVITPEPTPVPVYESDGWSMSELGVLTIRSNEGWLDWLRQTKLMYSKNIVIEKGVTELTLFDMSETVPVQGFYRSTDIIGHDDKGAPIYNYLKTSFISPYKIYLAPENEAFTYSSGMLIDIQKKEVVLTDSTLPREIVVPDGILSIGNGAFRGRNMDAIQLPNTLQTIGTEAFGNCSLTEIDLPDSVTSIGMAAFRDCSKLTNVKFSKNLTRIEEESFRHTGLYAIVLPKSVQEIGEGAFFRCLDLQHVQLPELLQKIGSSAFMECDQLNYVWFSDQIESICPSAFAGCTKLEEIILPDSLKMIGMDAFQGCKPTILRIPPELQIYDFDFELQEFIPGAREEDAVSLGLESTETIIFSGSEYGLGTPAIFFAKNIYFQTRPPENISEILPESATRNIYCSEKYRKDWTDESIAGWLRDKIEFVSASKINNMVNDLLRAKPEPYQTPQPTLSPNVSAENKNQPTDPIIILMIVFIVLVIAAVVLLYLKPWAKKRKRRKKRKPVPQLPAATPKPIEPPETEHEGKPE